ncbi:MAG: MbnP family copper-binding protein [Woeseiaceae bacterium]
MRRHLILAGLVMLLGCSCSEPYLGVKIPFVATWGDKPIDCDDNEITLSDLRLYVSEIELDDARGRKHTVVLHDNLQWQQPDLALIDLENGKGGCTNGTGETYAYLVGSVPPGDYKGLRFTVGVPFDRNHADPLKADSPLDDPAMHWHWRSGYKFLRAGIKTETDGFWIHTGSAGCEGTVRDIKGCRFPNRINVELAEFQPGRDSIAVNLKALSAGTDLADGLPTDCSSGPPETACIAPFSALGIDFESGKPAGQQRVFSILP